MTIFQSSDDMAKPASGPAIAWSRSVVRQKRYGLRRPVDPPRWAAKLHRQWNWCKTRTRTIPCLGWRIVSPCGARAGFSI